MYVPGVDLNFSGANPNFGGHFFEEYRLALKSYNFLYNEFYINMHTHFKAKLSPCDLVRRRSRPIPLRHSYLYIFVLHVL